MSAWALAVIAGIVVAYAVVSRRLDATPVTAAIFFVTCGFVFGKKGLDWVDPRVSSEEVRLLAEATLTLVLFADASRIDLRALRREYLVPARLLGIGLPLTILAGWALAYGVFGELSAGEALLLAIILAPTDAALGQAVVTDQRLPSRVRQGLNVESGLNDGICVPLLFIALAIAEADQNAISVHHAVALVVEEIGYGILGGVIAGVAGALVLRLAKRRGLVADDWLQVIPVAAAALSYGIAAPLGGSGFIAAFVGGLVFGVLVPKRGGSVTYLVEIGGQTLSGVTFLVIGAVALGTALGDLDWQIALYAVLSLTVVRMIPVALSLLGSGARTPTVLYSGWFGPRGLASIVFGVIVLEGSSLAHVDLLVTTAVITVALSVFAHGLTAIPLTNAYVRWYEAHTEKPPMEAAPVREQRWRRPVPAPGRVPVGAGGS